MWVLSPWAHRIEYEIERDRAERFVDLITKRTVRRLENLGFYGIDDESKQFWQGKYMSDLDEYRCFVGSLSWSTTDRGLKEAFQKYGRLLEAKVVMDRFSGRSCGFGFVSFEDKRAMEEAIEAMNGMDLDRRHITVEKAQPTQGGGKDRDGDYDRGRGSDRDRDFDRGGVHG